MSGCVASAPSADRPLSAPDRRADFSASKKKARAIEISRSTALDPRA
jgi:hypothetical protein